ncbi:uncharacterized protein [Dermacentor andersoni]|uniref:uncharacterized protein n=1 Tax=Dermacentor andersoni TaxID=34620 RepID=UPI0024159BEA|nr:uncharacterized protein LOC129383966 [Dermacentor andersoni]
MHIQAAVIYGHVTFDDRGYGVVVPPTFWNSSATAAHYPFNLDTAHTALQNMATEKLGYTQLFLSVTMAGRLYKPHKHPGMLEKNDAIKDPLFVSIALACKSDDYTWGYHNTTPMGAYYHSWKRRRTLTYDDEDSFREKLCKGKRLIPNVTYGLAAYDADLDDRSNACGQGAYARLRFLKKLLHFFNEKFREASDYEGCLQV